MYSWGDDTDDWAKPGTYKFDESTKVVRDEASRKAAESGPRTYHKGKGPVEQMVSPAKRILSTSTTPVVVAVDVTGSMASWPAEIFDRLPLLYQTLSQYRSDIQIAFAAIGDIECDRWPLQITDFAEGFTLDNTLKAMFGEGGGGDIPESYGAFAWWMNRRAQTPNAQGKPFLIVFGDAPMHETVPAKRMTKLTGEQITENANAITEWQKLCENWNVWFLRRPTGTTNDATEQQWRQAVGSHFLHLKDEQRAIDYALAIIGRIWGHQEDVRANMLARQPEAKVDEVLEQIRSLMAQQT